MAELDDFNVDDLAEKPSLLIALCRHVIQKVAKRPEIAGAQQQELQLREIAKTIQRLEKLKIPVPDPLRAEKMRLVVALSSESKQVFSELAQGFEEILDEVNEHLGKTRSRKALDNESNGKVRKKKRLPKTPSKVLREHIVRVLKKMGGRAKPKQIIAEIGKRMEGKLLPGDLEWRASMKQYVWQVNVRCERNEMRTAGILRSDSQDGYWELSEDYK